MSLYAFLEKRASIDPERSGSLSNAFGGERTAMPFRGVRALMTAVLEEALQSYLGQSPVLRREAECWILSDRQWTFSFVFVCESLGLDPGAVRAAFLGFRRDRVPYQTLTWRPYTYRKKPGRPPGVGRSPAKRGARIAARRQDLESTVPRRQGNGHA